MRFIDTHCHIGSDPLRTDVPGVISRARDAGVGYMLTVGSDLATSAQAVELARAHEGEGVYAAVGVHPHEAKTVADGFPEALPRLAGDPRVVAVGETGLDYYYDHSPRVVQRNVFRRHVEWAFEIGKPLVIHVRDAMPDALELLAKMPFDVSKIPLVFHCYAGGLEYLKAMKDLGAYLSIGGPVTWPKNQELREVASRVPENRLLCETDSPWLTPKPYRGKPNEPAYVRFVYEEIAKSRGVSVDALAEIVDANAARLFGWNPLFVRART
ncbi:MAG: TatD family hydrolase [Synergistaceae bacterium]|nr:TatD family hydrolase [Synergistaceae bacterium]